MASSSVIGIKCRLEWIFACILDEIMEMPMPNSTDRKSVSKEVASLTIFMGKPLLIHRGVKKSKQMGTSSLDMITKDSFDSWERLILSLPANECSAGTTNAKVSV